MAGVELILSLFQRASAQGSRSTAMNPLIWLAGMVLVSLLWAAGSPSLPHWVPAFLAVAAGFVVIAFLVAYFYLARKDPDLLRSERFTLSKMALQRSMEGDDLTGLKKPAADEPPPLSLPAPEHEAPASPEDEAHGR